MLEKTKVEEIVRLFHETAHYVNNDFVVNILPNQPDNGDIYIGIDYIGVEMTRYGDFKAIDFIHSNKEETSREDIEHFIRHKARLNTLIETGVKLAKDKYGLNLVVKQFTIHGMKSRQFTRGVLTNLELSTTILNHRLNLMKIEKEYILKNLKHIFNKITLNRFVNLDAYDIYFYWSENKKIFINIVLKPSETHICSLLLNNNIQYKAENIEEIRKLLLPSDIKAKIHNSFKYFLETSGFSEIEISHKEILIYHKLLLDDNFDNNRKRELILLANNVSLCDVKSAEKQMREYMLRHSINLQGPIYTIKEN